MMIFSKVSAIVNSCSPSSARSRHWDFSETTVRYWRRPTADRRVVKSPFANSKVTILWLSVWVLSPKPSPYGRKLTFENFMSHFYILHITYDYISYTYYMLDIMYRLHITCCVLHITYYMLRVASHILHIIWYVSYTCSSKPPDEWDLSTFYTSYTYWSRYILHITYFTSHIYILHINITYYIFYITHYTIHIAQIHIIYIPEQMATWGDSHQSQGLQTQRPKYFWGTS